MRNLWCGVDMIVELRSGLEPTNDRMILLRCVNGCVDVAFLNCLSEDHRFNKPFTRRPRLGQPPRRSQNHGNGH